MTWRVGAVSLCSATAHMFSGLLLEVSRKTWSVGVLVTRNKYILMVLLTKVIQFILNRYAMAA